MKKVPITTISPFEFTNAAEVELADSDGKKKSYWKKQIFPSGTRNYKGTVLDFSKINPSCVRSFDEKVFDSVPFVLPLSDNSHPMTGQEVDTLEGNLHKLELAGDGSLQGYFDLSQSPMVVDKIRKMGGQFGVSGRIEVNYERPDTQETFDYVLSHVCGTTRPHIRGMKPWEEVEINLSDSQKGHKVLDFSTEVEKDDGIVTVPISKQDLDELMEFVKSVKKADAEVEKLLTQKSKDDDSIQLSEVARSRIELAEKQANEALASSRAAQIELAETRWNARKAELVRSGVPPVILNLAETALKYPSRATIDLSDSEKVDVTKVLEDVLDACKGFVPLTEGETGHQVSSGEAKPDEDYMAFEREYLANFGNV
jgi:hypothetical protein